MYFIFREGYVVQVFLLFFLCCFFFWGGGGRVEGGRFALSSNSVCMAILV